MKNPLYKSILIVMMLVLVLSACAPATPTQAPIPTEAPKPTDAPKATDVPKPTATSAPQVPKGAVTSLDDVKGATIQIQAEGTFIDPEVGMVVNGAGRGSGFIIDPSGIAVTNNHVVTGSALLKVWVGGNKDKIYNARVLGASECSDLAVIKIEGSGFPFLQWHDGTPKVGLEVYAAGYPLGDPEYTLTKGIVSKANASGKTSWASVESVLEHDARINPGSSGSPLVDKDGKIVGINYAGNPNNQYFAIAEAEADSVLNELKGGTDVTSIGVNGQAIYVKDQNLSGVWVSSVKSGSPADKSGVQAGDIIVQMEGLVLATDGTMASYCQILRSHKASDTLSINVVRWSTQEILEGQLNGRLLKVTGTFGGGSQSSGNQGSSGPVTVSDDSKVISMDIPADWEYNGSAWENTWNIAGKSIPFVAQTLTASPNVSDYNDYKQIGLFIATSRDWASIGGFMNLLDGVRVFYTDCTATTSKALKTDNYEGQALLYNRCPNKMNVLVYAARPIKNPTAYLVLIEYKYFADADLTTLDDILNTATINP